VAAKRLAPLNPDVRIVPVMAEMNPRSLPGLIRDSHIVLDCLDNPETRIALNRACMAHSIPMVHAAVSEFTGHLSFLNPPGTPCLECFVSDARPAADPAVPGVTAGVMGTLEAMEAIKFLTGIGETLSGRLLVMEGAEPRFDIVALERDPSCPACSRPG
jgi:molybdopterin/thiamine biosynthesis adenylyltransferase